VPAEGWQGAWIDTYRNRKRVAIKQCSEGHNAKL
jgi:hypothetical protein